MPSVQKRTSIPNKSSGRPQSRETRKSPKLAEKSAVAVKFGERLSQVLAGKRDGRGKPWSNGELARRLQKRRGLESPPTRSVGLYRSGDRLPAAEEMADLAEVLDVPIDWLLCGRGPVTRAQVDDARPLEEALLGHVRKELHRRLRVPQADGADNRFAALEEQHLDLNGSDLLDRLVRDAEREFREHYDRLFDDANKARSSAIQAEVINTLVEALPLGPRRSAAQRAARTLDLDASIATFSLLTAEGVAALLPWWQLDDTGKAAQALLSIAKGLTDAQPRRPR